MISESYYWKKELLRSFTVIASFVHQSKRTEASFVNAEKAIMISAYIIRKLADAEKIPLNFIRESIQLQTYKSEKLLIDHHNCHRIYENYNYSNCGTETRDIEFLLNQIIHSFVLTFSFDERNKPNGFYINSDRTKNEKLYFVSLKDCLYFILKISEGSIVCCEQRREIVNHSNGDICYGEMKQYKAEYGYPRDFILDKAVDDTMAGKIYKRPKDYN